jgi:hypothetical protein
MNDSPTPKTATEILAEITAADKLRQEGWTHEQCCLCKGLGWCYTGECPRCNGKGGWWHGPTER